MRELVPRTEHTPNCFEATLEVASETESTVVVHGWLHAEGRWILHAWCEVGNDVIDLTESREPIPKADYHAVMGVTEERTRRYSRLEFFTLAAGSGGFGPFDEAFFAGKVVRRDPLLEGILQAD